VPYANWDADAGLQLYYALHPLLDYDHDGNSCREAFWESQIATTGVLDMHRTGICINRQRVDQLYKLFSDKRDKLLEQLRTMVRWPELNIRSPIQVKELLYGYKLNGKLDESNKPVKVSPEGAVCLGLEPVLDTGKPAKRWAEIPVGRRKDHSPTTAAVALSLLQQELATKPKTSDFDKFCVSVLSTVSDYKYLDQVLKTVLRPPEVLESTGEPVYDDDGNMSYESGLVSYTCDDGRIRTHIYQTKETGRWSTARPNLQNMAKKREKDYARIFGDVYEQARLRSIMRAADGHVLLEVDYIGAELFGMAVLSGDKVMIDHVMRNQLAEDDPNYYDIHSNMAVRAFRLSCEPTKAGLDSIGKGALRIIAKSILFGLAYGRGPAAIALEAKQQNVDMSVQEAQDVIDTIFSLYPELYPFLRQAKLRATGLWRNPDGSPAGRYLCNSFGRYRRFPQTADRSLLAEFERQAMNFPLQSLVASAVSRAVAYLIDFRDRYLQRTGKKLFSLLLQIHDALLLEVPYAFVRYVSEIVVPYCMRQRVPIYPTDLGGALSSRTPYYLGIDGEIMQEWGHKIPTSQATLLGLPTGQFRGDGISIVYSK
jgi:DNA polymerase I-like protein with 3'-5' exonuclease and polymerase domains